MGPQTMNRPAPPPAVPPDVGPNDEAEDPPVVFPVEPPELVIADELPDAEGEAAGLDEVVPLMRTHLGLPATS